MFDTLKLLIACSGTHRGGSINGYPPGILVKTTATAAPSRLSDPPQWITNLLKYLLRTPLHFICSKSLVLLVFRGRKSGRVYSTVVSYLRVDDAVTAFTDSPWQRNLAGTGPVPVTMYLRGKEVRGLAQVIDHREAVTKALTHFIRKVRWVASFYGVSFDANDQPIREQVERGSQHHVLLQIRLCVPSAPATPHTSGGKAVAPSL